MSLFSTNETEKDVDEPYIYVLIFFMVLFFFGGIMWIFCCGTCVGREALRAFGLGKLVPSDDGSEEEWEMLEEGRDGNNSSAEEWDDDWD
ncbi:11544_t:CDS:2 [Ambispora leptoticha]|uniref:11544_t:CDS:1 n=1 Tax=Ambispora leptoticha TaxID=144679 RepID=A0A9N9EZT6_9GLOM|nr:11544_t:CDS:2 [Ambispora leptoticha]